MITPQAKPVGKLHTFFAIGMQAISETAPNFQSCRVFSKRQSFFTKKLPSGIHPVHVHIRCGDRRKI